jgi:hypothetical protein
MSVRKWFAMQGINQNSASTFYHNYVILLPLPSQALPGEDYMDVMMNVILSQGQPMGCVIVPIIPDDVPEDSEGFNISIAGVVDFDDVNIHIDQLEVTIKGMTVALQCVPQ